jgi:hypothetical protein
MEMFVFMFSIRIVFATEVVRRNETTIKWKNLSIKAKELFKNKKTIGPVYQTNLLFLQSLIISIKFPSIEDRHPTIGVFQMNVSEIIVLRFQIFEVSCLSERYYPRKCIFTTVASVIILIRVTI